MKTKSILRKTAIMSLFLALVMLLGGCSLVVKDPQVDLKQTVLSVNGETTDKASFIDIYNRAYQQEYQLQQMYMQYGLTQQVDIDPDQLLSETLDAQARETVLRQKAREAGLDALSDEEAAIAQAQGEAAYQDILSQVQEAFFADTQLTGEALTQAMDAKSEELGYPRSMFLDDAREEALDSKLRESITKDVTVTPEEIAAEYDARVEQAKTEYAESPSAYGEAVNQGETVYYAPKGYRFVKQVLIKFLPEDKTEIDQLQGELTALQTALSEQQAKVDEYQAALQMETPDPNSQALLDSQAAELTPEETGRYRELLALTSPTPEETSELLALQMKTPVYTALDEAQAAVTAKQAELEQAKATAYANILPKAQEVYGLAQAPDADFDALAAQYNEDTGMPETGYAVTENFTSFDEAFVKPAMALESVGDVAEPSPGMYGYYITQYAADIAQGPASLDAVQDTLLDELLQTKKGQVYSDTVDQWVAASEIVKYPERMKD